MNSNFRHLLVGLSLLVGVAAPWAAIAQAPINNVGSGSPGDRLSQLETAVSSQGQILYQIQQQLADNQRDIDMLRGQIQESEYKLNQVVERQKDLYMQLDNAGGGNSANSSGASDTSASNSQSSSDNSSAASNAGGNEKDDYNAAVKLAMESKSKAQIDEAIGALQGFVKAYPKSGYQSNANYWLGQLNYNKGSKDDAAFYFATVVKQYPKSQKSSESLYKVGLIMQDKGQTDKAKAVYQQVLKQYPNSSGAKLAEKKLSTL
ncbi:cell division protein CpoB [Providencia heimbachae]|uniref:Cell division coordinator CpoB n=1 Tax=Providencia heimbachae ATCC 35613 TaxID=1354272 RepID=A0A1B7JZ31_9GAMM|nr:cell division protein CpoB [Providencia heimbachae]MDD9339925.1 cell division protein CpoB [Providencia heimbachae]NIH23592.1 cell division protein CpoB [Providencia heimbachae]OAT53140.1 exported TPR repeat-containing prenylyltransferase domain protein [Providencia heimbachae ATCC 35613]QCJ71053.1 cell division protein CpoB [Providencia heimbachae]SQH14174.1 tol-pal system protein YbgF [Providencia heimbachae]